jgi:hypothetical protein
MKIKNSVILRGMKLKSTTMYPPELFFPDHPSFSLLSISLNLYLTVDEGEDDHASLPENRDAGLDSQWELPKPKEVAHGLLHH